MTRFGVPQTWNDYCKLDPLNLSFNNRKVRLIEIQPVVAFIAICLHKYALDAAPPFKALSYSTQSHSEPVADVRCKHWKLYFGRKSLRFSSRCVRSSLPRTSHIDGCIGSMQYPWIGFYTCLSLPDPTLSILSINTYHHLPTLTCKIQTGAAK